MCDTVNGEASVTWREGLAVRLVVLKAEFPSSSLEVAPLWGGQTATPPLVGWQILDMPPCPTPDPQNRPGHCPRIEESDTEPVGEVILLEARPGGRLIQGKLGHLIQARLVQPRCPHLDPSHILSLKAQ